MTIKGYGLAITTAVHATVLFDAIDVNSEDLLFNAIWIDGGSM